MGDGKERRDRGVVSAVLERGRAVRVRFLERAELLGDDFPPHARVSVAGGRGEGVECVEKSSFRLGRQAAGVGRLASFASLTHTGSRHERRGDDRADGDDVEQAAEGRPCLGPSL
jgi:hypothetical protein